MNAITQHRRTGTANRIRGFSLVEVLIAVLLIAIGLLGMVGMQAAAHQGNQEARRQAIAVTLARELADLMRGNKDIALAAGNPYLGTFANRPLRPTTTSDCLQPGHRCAFDPANPSVSQNETAQAQMTDWLARVDAALPKAKVVVCEDSAPFDSDGLPVWACTAPAASSATVVVKMGWTRRKTESGDAIEATDAASRPLVVIPVTPGNSE